LAREAAVDALVSGDADLLALAPFEPPIVSPSRVLEQLGEST
jgi:predicted nucleic acid-binding protein